MKNLNYNKEEKGNVEPREGDTDFPEFRCPRCGEELKISTNRQIRSFYPSPVLEAMSCSNQNCNFKWYRKVSSSDL